MKKILSFFAVFAFACNGGDSPTGPSNVPDSGTTVRVSNTEQEVTAPQQPAAQAPRDVHVTVNSDGSVHVFNALNSTYTATVCVFNEGSHPQKLNNEYEITVRSGHKEDFPLEYNSDEECGELLFQVDVGFIDCSRPSDDLGDIHGWARNVQVVLDECECVPTEPYVVRETPVKWGDYSECADEHQLPPLNSEECYKIREGSKIIVYSDGCKEWETIEDLYQTEGCACKTNECETPTDLEPRAKVGNPWDECASYGDFVPVCKTEAPDDLTASAIELPSCEDVEADFYICKQATEMQIGLPGEGICEFDWSHYSGCVCDY